ncbi:MAG: competence protein ComK [Sedimentibacter sp.]
MKKSLKFNEIEAMLPVYVKDRGNCTEIVTKDASYIENATIETCIKKLADYYNISLFHNRINYGNELGITNKVPITINENLVYIYVNVREPLFKHDAAYGFVDINKIEEVFQKNNYAAIQLSSGKIIQTRQSMKSLKKNMLYGRLAKDIYKEKHRKN